MPVIKQVYDGNIEIVFKFTIGGDIPVCGTVTWTSIVLGFFLRWSRQETSRIFVIFAKMLAVILDTTIKILRDFSKIIERNPRKRTKLK